MMQPRLARQLLLAWYKSVRRDLPWRATRDPWRILVSEVMLQQTRVSVVIPYYERFLARFPQPEDLAGAPEQELLTAWSGLGYYTRARNLKRAAQAIVQAGSFPADLEGIRELPGVGEYTAAAIASIAFGLPHSVVDGNVLRVLSRYHAEKGDIQSATVRVRMKEEAQRLLDARASGDFNQAMMELGATVCLPRNPQCLLCPWRDDCKARALGIQAELPVKLRKREAVKLQVQLLVVQKEGRLLLRQRGAGETRLAGFWELPQAEDLRTAERGDLLGTFRHTITRHDYTVEVWRAAPVKAPKGYRWFSREEVGALPLATMSRKALDLAGL